MPRIRTIKPDFWTDGKVVRLSHAARLLFIGMWNFALDCGHLSDDPVGLKLKILPADDVDPEGLVDSLVQVGLIDRRQTPGGRSYLHVRNFSQHQKIEKRWPGRCPYCEDGRDDGSDD